METILSLWKSVAPFLTGVYLERYLLVLVFLVFLGFTGEIIYRLVHKRATRISFFTRFLHRWNSLIFVLFLLVFFPYISTTPKIMAPQLPLFDLVEITGDKPLVVAFDRAISKRIQGKLNPPVSGNWQLGTGKGRLPFNELRFYPQQPLEHDSEYSVELTNIAPLTASWKSIGEKLLFVFKTPPASPDGEASGGRGTLVQDNSQLLTPILQPTETPTPSPVPTTFVLNVPLYKQHHTFTCFSVAARMALGYRGVSIDEIGMLHEIGFDQTPRNFLTNTWGDPNTSVVGTFDGSGDGGYGVHWDPVARVLSKHRPVEIKRNWNIPDLLKTVNEDSPVMVWWVNGVWPARDVSWRLPNGEKVYTVNGMHVEVVVGWIGERDNPEFILTNDPWRGRRKYSQEQFISLWKWFENTALVIK